MNEMQKSGWAARTALAVGLVYATAFYSDKLIPVVRPQDPGLQFYVLENAGKIGLALIFLFIAYLHRRYIWKIWWRKHNIDGEWINANTYDVLQCCPRNRDKQGVYQRASNETKLTIVQSEEGVQVICGQGDPKFGTTWESIFATYDTQSETLHVMYEITRSIIPNEFEDTISRRTMGYERVTVTDRDWSGRPTKMQGHFYNCVNGNDAAYFGSAEYTRMK